MYIIVVLASFLAVAASQLLIISSLDVHTDITAIDFTSDKLYVASVNLISCLNLTGNLELLASQVTGPQNDSALCSYDGESCLENAHPTEKDYITRLLRVTNSYGILECGSLRQGVCQQRDPNTLTVIKNGSVSVVPNDQNSSCVSLIDAKDIIHVAASSTPDTLYRETMPAVSSRAPPDFSIINGGSIEGDAAVYLRNEYRNGLNIDYVAAFSYKQFNYFVSVQHQRDRRIGINSFQQDFVNSKLIRICRNDTRYVSYSEISVLCLGEDNHSYQNVTAVTIINATVFMLFTDMSGKKKSVVCIYRMDKIQSTYQYNMRHCHAGHDTVGLPHIGRDSKCVNRSHLSAAVASSAAAATDMICAMGFGGAFALEEIYSYEYGDIVTCSASTSFANLTILIIGTEHGSILQLHYFADRKIRKYDERNLSDRKISNIRFIDSVSYIVTAGSKIYKLSLNDCESRSSCVQCQSGGNPLCGWCLLEGRCSTERQCRTAIHLTESCPVSDKTVPSNISVVPNRMKILVPLGRYEVSKNAAFVCDYGLEKQSGVWLNNGVMCNPPKYTIKNFTGDHISTNVRVFYNGSIKPVTERSLVVYSCAAYKLCTSCTKAPWKCQWCANSGSCSSINTACQGAKKLSQCPHIRIVKPEHTYISNQQTGPIIFAVHPTGQLSQAASNLRCKVTLNNESRQTAAHINPSNLVVCNITRLSFHVTEAVQNAKLTLLHNNNIVDSTNVTIFSCPMMGSDCSSCFALDPKWNCAWCNGKCTDNANCNYTVSHQTPDTVCDQPIIYSVKPKSGPLEGGTVIEILGKDLGFSLADIQDRVTIGQSKCEVIDYELSSRILCIIGSGKVGSFPIHLQFGNTGRRYAKSEALYSFVQPLATHIFPVFGPQSGGTRITIFGENLTVGSNASVIIGSIPCTVSQSETRSGIICTSGASPFVKSVGPVEITIDNYKQTLYTEFHYRPDPVVRSIYPTASFRSGGRLIIVDGEHFDSILHPHMFIAATNNSRDGSISQLGDCAIQNSTSMFCRTPKVDIPYDHLSGTYSRWPVGFLMDNVESVRNYGYSNLQITVVPDPVFAPFDGIRLHKPGQPFIVEGNHLSHAAFQNEYQVFIGTAHCAVFKLEEERLYCQAPGQQPLATDETGNILNGGHPLFVVIIGSLRYELGLVEYESFSIRTLLKPLLLILCALFMLCISLGFLLYYIYKRRKLEFDGNYKRIQVKIDVLQNEGRFENKILTNELQLELSELSSAIEIQGIPAFEKAQYASKILFQNISFDQLNEHDHYSCESFDATANLDSVLWNKQFIVTLIEKIETDYSLSGQDRNLFATLLSAALLRDLNYFTDVVVTLLSYHIQKSVKNRNAHLLFHQNGSIIEKIFSYWFALCMYDDLRSSLSNKFYMLTEAIRRQISKGPTDVITGNARYALNENNLIREPINFSICQFLVVPLNSVEQSPVVVNALSCDTVPQFKAKILDIIYRSQPFSSRLSANQFDLVCRSPECGILVLRDDEQTDCKGFRKLKYLSDYGLPNNALLTMEPRSSNSLNHSCSDKSSISTSPQSSKSYSYYHLEFPSFSTMSTNKLQDSTANLAADKTLSQLLANKEMVQRYITEFIESLLLVGTNEIPIILKYTFDLFDTIAKQNKISDTKLIRSWKVNVWTLRFWLVLLANPHCFLNFECSNAVNYSIATVGTVLADLMGNCQEKLAKSCSTAELLFSKDMEYHRAHVKTFFRKIRSAKAVSNKQLSETIATAAKGLTGCINSIAVNSELLSWIRNTGLKLVDSLYDDDSLGHQYLLGQRISQLLNVPFRDNEHIYATLQ